MKASLYVLLAVCMLGLPMTAFAADGGFSIMNIRAHSNGVVRVYFNGSVDGTHCKYSPADLGSWLDFDSSTAGGKSMLSTLLSAKLSRQAVWIGYTGGAVCTLDFVQL